MAVQGVSIGMVIAPVTGSILAALPLERAGAGSAVNSTVRQTGAVLGIAAIGTVMTIVYRNAIAPTASTIPVPLRAKVRSSADMKKRRSAPASAFQARQRAWLTNDRHTPLHALVDTPA